MEDAKTVNNGMPPITNLLISLQEPCELGGATRENTTQPQQAELGDPTVNRRNEQLVPHLETCPLGNMLLHAHNA
eukprot:15292402-Alexandrium_andersonii.AAC.1